MAAKSQFSDIQACVFDAYGTLLDVNAAAKRCRGDLGDHAGALAEIWRAKQLQYTWLSSLMGQHKDFRDLTERGLDYALESLGLRDDALRTKLLELYEVLDAYPEVPDMLVQLKQAGMKTAILSNGTPGMLDSAVTAGGIKDSLDVVLSIEDVGIFKPDPRVYQLAVDRLGVAKENVCFVSSNGWDATGAAAFGFQVAWVNRAGLVKEKLGFEPKIELKDLTSLAELVV
ncbi:haloacid dehalogenase type II [Magnetovibrio sp. PR-2]|uniref:haloacid dehalogenase type II n=1 Tax=Magnetovibrio sp. PR-2 TaxID=3120356 RepID=UPI002FCE34ED